MTPVASALGVACLLLAAWSGLRTAQDRRVGGGQLLACAALTLALLAQAVAGFVALAVSDRAVDSVTFVGYHLTAVALLPVGALWAIGERSRWGNGVLAVAALVVPVLLVRLVQVWDGR